MKKSKSNQPPLTHFFHSGWIILVFNVRPPFQPLLTSSPPPTTHSLDTSIIQPQHLQPMDSTRGPLVIFFSNYFLKSMLFYIVFFLSLFIFKWKILLSFILFRKNNNFCMHLNFKYFSHLSIIFFNYLYRLTLFKKKTIYFQILFIISCLT